MSRPVATPSAADLARQLWQTGRPEQAIACAEMLTRAGGVSGGDLTALQLEQAHALRESGRYGDALALYRAVLTSHPGMLAAAAGIALTLFYQEDWQAAWSAYAIRFKLMKNPPMVLRRLPDGTVAEKPRWTGGPAPRSLMVIAEQGFGDTIQFIRYVPQLVAQGTKVACVVPRRLFGLLGTLQASIDFRPGEAPGQVEGMETWIPMLDLPAALGLGPDGLSPQSPYLFAEAERVALWRDKLPPGFKIGIVWRGKQDSEADVARSMRLADFAPLAAIPGVTLVALQRDGSLDEIRAAGFADRVHHLGDDFDSGENGFLDTAAVMTCCDLIVSVDTSAVHLAGALGRPVWILLKRPAADWRWLHLKERTAWYPTARLWHQAGAGDWAELVRRVADALALERGVGPTATAVPAARQPLALPAPVAAPCPLVPVSVGELLDKLTILDIKAELIADPAKLANVRREHAELDASCDRAGIDRAGLAPLIADLAAVNRRLWQIEDEIRLCEQAADFGARFVELARSVYHQNDWRAALKRRINDACGSALVEEKSYAGLSDLVRRTA